MLCETVSVSEVYEGALGIDCHFVPRWKTWLQACYNFCVAQRRRVWSRVNINIKVESWWGMCRLALGRGWRLDGRLEFRSRSRRVLYQTEH